VSKQAGDPCVRQSGTLTGREVLCSLGTFVVATTLSTPSALAFTRSGMSPLAEAMGPFDSR
jgi:hypothetical protein